MSKRKKRRKKRTQRAATRTFDSKNIVKLRKLVNNSLKRFEKLSERTFNDPIKRDRFKSYRPESRFKRNDHNILPHKNHPQAKPIQIDRHKNIARRRRFEEAIQRQNRDRVCRKRMDRRDALFATNIAGKGKGGPKRRTITSDSKVRC